MKWHLEQMFGYINIVNDDEEEWECLIMDKIEVLVDRTKTTGGGLFITVEWINDNLMADSLADSVVAILYSIDSSPASVKLSSKPHSHSVKQENGEEAEPEKPPPLPKFAHADNQISGRLARISALLRAQFGDTLNMLDNGNSAKIKIGKNEATVNLLDLQVDCGSGFLKSRIENIIKRGCGLTAPLSQYEKK